MRMKMTQRKKRLNRSLYGDASLFAFLFLICGFMVLPLLYSVMLAFKPIEEIFIFPPRFYVVNPTLENFRMMFNLASDLWVPFSRYLFNSVFISVVGTTGVVLIGSMAAYPLAKREFPGKKIIFRLIIIALLFTPQVTAIPRYVVLDSLGFVNTYYASILPAFASTLGIYLMIQFMQQIENEILESAKIDGATEMRIFWQIVMPNVKPGWLTLIVFTFQGLWNSTGTEFVYNESLKTLPAALGQIAAGGIMRTGVGGAVAFSLMIPPILIFVFTQSKVIETMSHSGLKG